MSQQDPFAGLEPRALWQHFSAFTGIARPSGKEQQMAEYVRNWAREHRFDVKTDGVGNIAVHVPASPGREKAPVVVLQGHLDMVCERNADSAYNPEEGRIHVVRDGDWIRSEGTTLGADNGIGVASGMSIAEDPSVSHGPIDLLMTIDEETGMTGAQGLDGSILRGRTMLNLDSEEDTFVFVGCAGGGDLKATFKAKREAVPTGHVGYSVTVKGLLGGHSGIDIDKNRMNAIHALTRILQDGAPHGRLLLSSFQGGSKRNAIPRESTAIVALPPDAAPGFEAAVDKTKADLLYQFKGLDDGLQVVVEKAPVKDAFGGADSARLLDFLRAVPSGVIAMSQDIKGLVETSTNLGVITTAADTVEIFLLSRSSVGPALADLLDAQKALGRLSGIPIEYLGGYPGWKPDMQSKALGVTRSCYERLFGNAPDVTAIHAGLECGLIGERVPGMDMVSFGPTIVGVHAPGERVSVSSVQKFYKLLGNVLDELAK